jgi:hypothetical protein
MFVKRAGVLAATVGMSASLAIGAAARADTPVALCVPAAGGAAITTPTSGTTCAAGSTYKQVASQSDLTAAEARVSALEAVLAGVTRTTVNGQPTIRFSGANVQIVNGSGATNTTNGKGNLILGYDETPRAQTGSHNLVLGLDQSLTSWGSVVGGAHNTSTGPVEALFGGWNRAVANYAAVTGGYGNFASSRLSSISGGCENVTGTGTIKPDGYCQDPAQSTTLESISGGSHGSAVGQDSSISGGDHNTASAVWSSIAGGDANITHGDTATIAGGRFNNNSGDFAALLGGNAITLTPTDGTYPAGP